jgi:hypothetical protein
MKIYKILLVGFSLLIVASCGFFGTGLKGNGNVIIENRKVTSFSEIEIDGVLNVILNQGSKEAVNIEADDNLVDLIVVTVSGKKLIIDLKDGESIHDYTELNVFITLVDINKVYVDCVGDVTVQSPLVLESLTLESLGVGDIDLVLDCNNLMIDKSSVGDITLSGQTNSFKLNSSGVGDVLAFKLDSKKTIINKSGVGDIQVTATKSIDIETSGVGNIEYKGKPKSEIIEENGVGDVDRM